MKRPYTCIDSHTHILPSSVPKWKEQYGYGEFINIIHSEDMEDPSGSPGAQMANQQDFEFGFADMYKGDKYFRRVSPNTWDPETRIKEMKEMKVSHQVICTIPVMFSYWAKPEHCVAVNEYLNNDIANTVKKNDDYFIGLGSLPMNAPKQAAKELKRCLDIGINGFQIGSHINGNLLSDPELKPIWQVADDHSASILVHPWNHYDSQVKYWLPWLVDMPADTSNAICSLLFSGVFEKYPNIRFMFAHGGGSFPFHIGRIEKGFKKRGDIVAKDCKKNPREFCGHFWVDSINHDKRALKYNMELFGEDKVVCGSDYPFAIREEQPVDWLSGFLSKEQLDKVLVSNCLDWLGMSKNEINRD